MGAYIIGQGITNFGELWDRDLRSLGLEAALKALDSAKLNPKDIDALYIANMNSSAFSGQEHLGALFASQLNLDKPAFRVEGACASGSLAINAAFNAINSGKYKRVMVIGVEKMTDLDASQVTQALAAAADEEWESYYGATFPSLYALIAKEHMRRFGTTKEDLALISIKNHYHALLNPIAQFKKEITVKDVVDAAMIAEPLGLLDCSPISDGAAAIILSNESKESKPVELVASEIATSSLSLHDRRDMTTIDAAVKASSRAYEAAGISAKDIDIAEVHDCFSIAELIAYEDLGFAPKGKAKDELRRGHYHREGKLPVNVSGGLKACGHPVGATGVKQAIEIYLQLSAQAGKRQVKKKKLRYGLTHNVGGSGATCVINIFKQQEK
jgi:acetyl-CoA C-acetyltransferase